MNNNELYLSRIDEKARIYTENIARRQGLPILQCPSADWAVRKFVKELLETRIIEPETLLNAMEKMTKNFLNNNGEVWWKKV